MSYPTGSSATTFFKIFALFVYENMLMVSICKILLCILTHSELLKVVSSKRNSDLEQEETVHVSLDGMKFLAVPGRKKEVKCFIIFKKVRACWSFLVD